MRNPKWWGDRPKLDKIVMRVLTPDAAIGAFVNGEVDVVDLGTEASAYRRAQGAAGGVVRVAAGSEFRHLTFNGTSDVLRDPDVRRAIALGINREAIAKADLAGLDFPARTMGNHFFVNTQAGYRDNSGEQRPLRPRRGRAAARPGRLEAVGRAARQGRQDAHAPLPGPDRAADQQAGGRADAGDAGRRSASA